MRKIHLIPIASAEQVRAYVENRYAAGENADTVAEKMGINRRSMFQYLQHGIAVRVTDTQLTAWRVVTGRKRSARKPAPRRRAKRP